MVRKRIFLNTLINSSGKLLSFGLQIFIVTYLIKSLGTESYGVFVLVLALVGGTNLLETGFGLSVTKYVAEYRAKGDNESILKIVNTNMLVATAIGVGFAVVLLLINELFLNRIFNIPDQLLNDARMLVRVLVPLVMIELWSVSLVRVAEGYQHFALARAMEVARWLMRAVLSYIAVRAGFGLVGVGAAYLIAGCIALSIIYYSVIIKNPELRLSPGLCDRGSFKTIFGFSVWLFLSKLFAFLSYRINVIVLGIFLPVEAITFYNVAFKVYEFLHYGLSLAASTLVPVVSELEAAMDKRRIAMLYERATRYSVVLLWPVFMVAYIYADEVVALWMGPGFESSVTLARLFIVSIFAVAVVSSGGEMMVGVNRLKELLKYNAVATAVNMAVSIYLVQVIGAPGVVIGTLAGSYSIALMYLPVMAKAFDVRMRDIILNAIIKPLPAVALVGLITYYLPFIVGAVVGGVVYVVLAMMFLVEREDREAALTIIKGRMR